MEEAFKHISDKEAFLELRPRSKRPVESDWRNKGKTFDAAKTPHGNVGLLLGEASGVLDADLDSPAAVAVADLILPTPHASFDRSTNDSAHYLYKASTFGSTQKMTSTEGNTLIELRGEGGQTMIPPSVHETGVPLRVTSLNLSAPLVTYDELHKDVSFVAAVAEVAANWREGTRHDLALAFAGYCLKEGIGAQLLVDLIDRIVSLTGDKDRQDRLNAVKTSAQKPKEKLEGFRGLVRILGPDKANRIADRIALYLGKDPSHSLQFGADRTSDIVNHGRFRNPTQHNEGDLGNELGFWLNRKALYVIEHKQWFLWDGVKWVPDHANQILQRAIQFVDETKAELIRDTQYKPAEELDKFKSVNRLENLIKVAATQQAIHVTAFDQNPMLVATRDTYLDLETGEIFAPDPDKLVSKSLDVSYDASASCPVFEGFIDEVFEGDRDLVHFVKKVLGYSLTGLTKEQAMFFLIGDGANGKSTFLNTLNSLWGDYGTSAASQMLIAGNSGVGDDLVDLIGARLVSVNETEEGQALAEAKVKQMTGGDFLKGRPLYGKWVEFALIAKLFLATNSLPQINNSDYGIWRRINTIPFNRTFRPEEQDRDLSKKLKAEMSGILNWVIDGCLAWQKEGLNPPKAVLDEVAEYQNAMDTVTQFIQDECDLEMQARTPASSLYADYQRFCGNLGKRPKNTIHFKKALSKLDGVEQKKTSSGNMWLGIKTTWTQVH